MNESLNPDVSLVLACYNEAGHLQASVEEIRKTMADTPWTYELIFVYDCGTDNTEEIIRQILATSDDCRAIFHESNVGRGGSVSDGLLASRGKVIGYIDVDLEVHCRYLPTMIRGILTGYDLVLANRVYFLKFSPGILIRHFLSNNYRRLVRFYLHLTKLDTEAGYKFFNRDKILPILQEVEDKGWFWDTEIVARTHAAGLKIAQFDCLFVKRNDKKSSVKLFRDSVEYFKNLRKLAKEIQQK